MKSFLLMLIGLVSMAMLYAQDISNSGFENWTSTVLFEEPEIYTTTNSYVVLNGDEPNVIKSTDAYSGNFALQLETVNTSDGPLFGAAFIGELAEGSIGGGIPFTQRPDSVSGYAKYDIEFGDTAFMAVLFKKFGAPLGICSLAFVGTQNQYQYFSAPVSWFLPIISPDSLLAGFISSSFNNAPIVGSTITFDEVSFVGASASFPNGDFEDWNEIGSEEPDDWFTTNLLSILSSGPGVTKSTDSHSGAFAAQLESVVSITGDSICLITNGEFTGDEGPTGGMAVNEFPLKVSGYYKYAPVGPDTALAGMWLYHYDAIAGITETLQEIIIKLPPVSNYTYFEVPVTYYNVPVPDTVNITFAPSNYADGGNYIGLGSTLLIDDLEITYQPFITATNESILNEDRVYPNPASEKLNIEFKEALNQETTITIANSKGQIVSDKKASIYNGKLLSIDLTSYPPGIYYYTIQTNVKKVQGKFIVK